MEFMAMMFDRERRAMSNYCANKSKVKKNRVLFASLAFIDDNRRD